MGKRKLHGQTYYQCDWTGYPMRQTNCYMPSWQGSKMSKRGSYCNWESVLAHAHHMYNVDKSIDGDELTRIRWHLKTIMGELPDYDKYHFSFLEHFKDDPDQWRRVSDVPLNMSMDTYHAECCKTLEEITAVKITASGQAVEVIMDPNNGKYEFENYISKPSPIVQALQDCYKIASFQSTQRGKSSKELTVFYWPFNNGLVFNTLASNIFKMQIYGDVLLVQQSKEAVSYTHLPLPTTPYV